jgi:hypothetical protein
MTVIPPLTRSDLLEMAKHAAAVLDNPHRSKSARAGAAKVYAECSHELLFANDATELIRLVPLTFRIRNWYSDTLESVLARLDDADLTARQRLSILMARKAAIIADRQDYSSDMRLDAESAFHVAVDGIRDGDPERLCW